MKTIRAKIKFLRDAIIRGGIREYHDVETSRKIIMINIICLIGILNLVPLGINSFSEKNSFLGIFDLSVAALLIAIQVVLRKTGNHKIPSYLGIACAGGLFFYLYISGGVAGTGHLWLFTFPLFASFLLGAKRGAVATAVLTITSIVFPVVFKNLSFVTSYSRPFTIRYSMALIVAFSFAYFFEWARDKTQGDLTEKNTELKTAIDELVQTERALKDSEEIYRNLVERANDGIVLIQNNRIEYVNPQLAELTGYPIEQIQNSEWSRYVYPTEQERISRIYRLRMKGESVPSRYETALRHKNGDRIDVEVNADVLTLKGQPGNLVFVRDFREHKKAEVKLNQAKDSAERANRAKSEFLANMSHELRTPLNHIMGFTELVLTMEDGNLNDNQIEYLTDVLSSSQHLLSLINDILDLSKIEAGKIEIEPTQTSIQKLFEGSMVMIKEKALKRRIDLVTHVHDLPDYIIADKRKLKQIMYNLLSNAVKFTPHEGKICMEGGSISHTEMTDLCKIGIIDEINSDILKDREWIQISVQDSGIGIEKGCLSLIFRPFEQLEEEDRQACEGTGLGLSLTKKLVELHGGRIWAESEGKGKGTTFRFILPILLNTDLAKLQEDNGILEEKAKKLEYLNKIDL